VALGEHLKAIGDPDADVFGGGPGTFRTGVELGLQGMPRVPEVFEAKEKWRKYANGQRVDSALNHKPQKSL
jgi:hypothetical protein